MLHDIDNVARVLVAVLLIALVIRSRGAVAQNQKSPALTTWGYQIRAGLLCVLRRPVRLESGLT
jgi:hypothetical protein